MKRWMIHLLLPMSLAIGCSNEPEAGDMVPIDQVARFALISVIYGHEWAPPTEEVHLATNAQFVRYTSMTEDQVSQLLALPLNPEKDLPALDECRFVNQSSKQPEQAAGSVEEPGNVELLEVGELYVESLGKKVALAPKHFPGLLPFVSGVVYFDRQTVLPGDEPGRLKASSDGGETVGPFQVELESPLIPTILRVGDSVPAEDLSLSKGHSLSLQWRSEGGHPDDMIYLELRFNQGKGEMVLRCRPQDDGLFEIPHTFLADRNGKISLELARLRRVPYVTTGIDRGEFRITAVDSLSLR